MQKNPQTNKNSVIRKNKEKVDKTSEKHQKHQKGTTLVIMKLMFICYNKVYLLFVILP